MKFIFLSAVFITGIFVGCSQTRHLKHEDILALETRDEQAESKMIICFEKVIIDIKTGSLHMAGRTLSTDSLPLQGVKIQFGIWKTADEGTYFIIREEFLSDSTGRFELKTKMLPDEWMIFESEIVTRFFNISGVWE